MGYNKIERLKRQMKEKRDGNSYWFIWNITNDNFIFLEKEKGV